MSEDEITDALAMLAAPRGAGPGADAARDAALDVLLAAPEAAHPRLLAMAEGEHPPPLALLALAVFGRPDSIPVLTRALRHSDAPTAATASDALARHPLTAARSALEAALVGTSPQVAAAAAAALRQRGDAAAVGPLRSAQAGWPAGEVRDAIAAAIAGLPIL